MQLIVKQGKCQHCSAVEGEYHVVDCPLKGYHYPNNPRAVHTRQKLESTVDSNDGSNKSTSHYDLPPDATELKHLIWHRNMSHPVGEIFCSTYRLGTASHSSKRRDLKKIIAYAEQELERIDKYGE